jgi:aspartate 1-decarboxylase
MRTCVIEGERGSGAIGINGADASAPVPGSDQMRAPLAV